MAEYTIQQLRSALQFAQENGNQEDAKYILNKINQMGATAQAESPVVSDVSPDGQLPGLGTAVRYGVPIGVGLATAPATLPTLAGAAGISALSSGGADLLGQFIEKAQGERQDMSGRDVLAATASGLAVPLKLKELGKLGNFLTNSGIFAASSESSRAITEGGFTPSKDTLESVMRISLPAVTGLISAKAPEIAERTSEYATRAKAVKERRFGGGLILSDIDERYTDLERSALAGNSRKVRALLDDMTVNFGDALRTAFKDAPNAEELARPFIPYQRKIDRLKQGLDAATAEYQRLSDNAAQAAANNSEAADLLKRQASDAGAEVVAAKALYEKGLNETLGSLGSDVSSFITAERIPRVLYQINRVKGSIKGAVGRLYDTAGIRENDIVANESDLIDWIKTGVTAQTDREAYADSIKRVLQMPGMKDDAGNITLKAYRDMRDKLVGLYRTAGQDATSAHRTAAQVYDAIKTGSEAFLEANRKDALPAFQRANAAARSIYAAREGMTGIIPAIEDANIGGPGGVLEIIKAKGYPSVKPDIDAYVAAIRGFGDDASRAAADQFSNDLHKAIRDEMVGQAIVEGSGQINDGFKAIDMRKLATSLSSLVSEKGVPSELLGLGTKTELDALARLARRENRKGFTAGDLDRFFNDVSLVGYDRALAETDYREAMRSYSIANNKGDKKAAMDRALAAQAKGKLDVETAARLADEAAQDPLARLFNSNSFQVDPDSTRNGEWIGRLLNVGESDLKKLMATLRETKGVDLAEAARRGKLADDVAKATTAEMLFRPLRAATGETGQTVDLTGITNLFYGEGSRPFKAIIGDTAFQSLKETWGKSAAEVLQKRINLGLPAFTSREDMMAAAAAAGLVSGNITGGAVAGTGGYRIMGLLDRGRYGMLWLMYGEPKTAKMFKDAAYNVDKFMAMSPRNAILVQLAERQDDENEQKVLQRQYLSQP